MRRGQQCSVSRRTSCCADSIKIRASSFEEIYNLILCQLVTVIDDLVQQCRNLTPRCWPLADVQETIFTHSGCPGAATASMPARAAHLVSCAFMTLRVLSLLSLFSCRQ